MVSCKRRRAGLKARETYLRRLAATPPPGFGPRLWNTGYPSNYHKALWRKINSQINCPKPCPKALNREFEWARAENAKIERELLENLRYIAEKKKLQEREENRKKQAEYEKQRKEKAKAVKAIHPNETESEVDPDETESEVDPNETETEADSKEAEPEFRSDEIESEADPDKTEG
ncbi:uncharacterized protein DFL_001521 [Arthrobotrys flagrans]|uniref:Uncharacterized protein n=1 Tax=Arthrobotrys flagrans TaxID=97331 RepID=A0A437A7V4_ARTFL|nr:hypothetical protein DFL_001521 [Arthrobotrys flagrans]